MIFLLRHNEQQSTFGDPTAVTTIQTATLLLRSSKLHLRLSCDSFASKKTPGKALPSEIQVTIIGSCPDQLSPPRQELFLNNTTDTTSHTPPTNNCSLSKGYVGWRFSYIYPRYICGSWVRAAPNHPRRRRKKCPAMRRRLGRHRTLLSSSNRPPAQRLVAGAARGPSCIRPASCASMSTTPRSASAASSIASIRSLCPYVGN